MKKILLLSLALLLTAAGSAGAVFFESEEVLFPEPSVTFYAAPAEVVPGGSTRLTWTSMYALSCTARGAWGGAKARAGSQVVAPQVTSTYTLSCTGRGGTTDASLVVAVTTPTPPPPQATTTPPVTPTTTPPTPPPPAPTSTPPTPTSTPPTPPPPAPTSTPPTSCAGFSVPACPAGTYPTPGAVDAKGCIGPSVCTAETRVSGPFLFAVPAQNAYAQGSAYAGGKATAGQRAAVVYAPTSGAATVTYENLALPSRAVTRLVGTVGLSPVKQARVGQRPTYRGSVTVTVTASSDKIDSSDAASEVLYTTTLSSITGPQQLSVPLGVWGMRPHTKLTVSVQKTKADAAVYGAVIDGLGYTTFGDRPDQGIVNNDPEWKSVDQQNKQLTSLATFPVTWIHDSMRTTGAGWGQAPLLKRVQDQGKKIQIVIGQVDEDYTEGTAARVPGTNQWGGALPLSKLHLDLYEKRLKNNLTSYKNAGVDIKAFEVGNELDLVGFNGDIPTNRAPTDADYKLFAETYARILERTVSVVKRPEFYPNAKIILGSPAIDWSPATGKLDPIKMYAPLQNLNGKNYFALIDGVGLHFYPAQSEDGSQSMARGEAYLDALGLSNRPVWVSEWGYANNTFPNSSGADRYRAFTTLYDRMLRADFKVVFMTNFALDEFSYPFHLVDTNYQKLPEARFFDHYQSPTPSTVVLERVAVPPVACTWCAVTAWAEELVARVRDTVLTKISNYPYGPKYNE